MIIKLKKKLLLFIGIDICEEQRGFFKKAKTIVLHISLRLNKI
jgi:hypothetical protein